MNTTSGSRHAHTRKRGNGHRKKSSPHVEKTVAPAPGRFFTFTLDADTGRVVKFALLDQSGTQHELSEEEHTDLLRAGRECTLEAVVARAFEAGIQCALEDAATAADEIEPQRSEEPEASGEEIWLRRLLLEQLIERSTAKDLLGRETLARAVLETLIHYSINEPVATTGPSTGPTAARTAHARTNSH
jgi:hypothetical protein